MRAIIPASSTHGWDAPKLRELCSDYLRGRRVGVARKTDSYSRFAAIITLSIAPGPPIGYIPRPAQGWSRPGGCQILANFH